MNVTLRGGIPRASVNASLGLSHGQTPRIRRSRNRSPCWPPRRRERRFADLHCRDCGSHPCACCRPDPRRPASAPGSPSRGRAASLVGADLAPGPDDDHSPRRRARDRCIRRGPCESRCTSKSVSRCSSAASRGKASAAAERSSACSPSGGSPGASGAAHTSRAGAEHGSNSQGMPRRARAISKPGVRGLDTGRLVRHGWSSPCLL
jgi:hypothetical protein